MMSTSRWGNLRTGPWILPGRMGITDARPHSEMDGRADVAVLIGGTVAGDDDAILKETKLR